jgi:hypothetical protein
VEFEFDGADAVEVGKPILGLDVDTPIGLIAGVVLAIPELPNGGRPVETTELELTPGPEPWPPIPIAFGAAGVDELAAEGFTGDDDQFDGGGEISWPVAEFTTAPDGVVKYPGLLKPDA